MQINTNDDENKEKKFNLRNVNGKKWKKKLVKTVKKNHRLETELNRVNGIFEVLQSYRGQGGKQLALFYTRNKNVLMDTFLFFFLPRIDL